MGARERGTKKFGTLPRDESVDSFIASNCAAFELFIPCVAYLWVRDYDVSTFVFIFLFTRVCCVAPRVSVRAPYNVCCTGNVTVGFNAGMEGGVTRGQNLPLYIPYCPERFRFMYPTVPNTWVYKCMYLRFLEDVVRYSLPF